MSKIIFQKEIRKEWKKMNGMNMAQPVIKGLTSLSSNQWLYFNKVKFLYHGWKIILLRINKDKHGGNTKCVNLIGFYINEFFSAMDHIFHSEITLI